MVGRGGVARQANGTIGFKERRLATDNDRISPGQVVQLLWRTELLEMLRELDVEVRAKATRRELWATLVDAVSPTEVFALVRDRLRARGDWRSGPTPFRDGGSSQSVAKSQRSP